MENNENLSPERSLEVISEMIDKHRRSVARASGTPMIVWGSLTTVTALVVGTLWQQTGSAMWNFLWLALAAIGWSYSYISHHKSGGSTPETFVVKMYRCVWWTFGVLCLAIIVLNYVASLQTGSQFLPYTSTIMLLMMFASALTSFMLKLREGGVCVVAGIVCILLSMWWPGACEMFFLALMSALCLIVPGAIINSRVRRGLL